MSCSCKGSCNFIEDGYFGNPKYGLGYKYCSTCAFSLKCENNFCPCCKTTLRQKPRHRLKEVSTNNESKSSYEILAKNYSMKPLISSINETAKNFLIREIIQ